jgi:hypothetical protein
MISQAQKNNLTFLEAGVYLCKESLRRIPIIRKNVCLIIDVVTENNTAVVLVNDFLLLVPLDSITQT